MGNALKVAVLTAVRWWLQSQEAAATLVSTCRPLGGVAREAVGLHGLSRPLLAFASESAPLQCGRSGSPRRRQDLRPEEPRARRLPGLYLCAVAPCWPLVGRAAFCLRVCTYVCVTRPPPVSQKPLWFPPRDTPGRAAWARVRETASQALHTAWDTGTLAVMQTRKPRCRVGRACLENPAQAQLCRTSRLWGLASAWSQEQGEPARPWDQVQATRAGGEKEGRGGWLLVVEDSRPRGSPHSVAWLGRVPGR